MKFLCDVHISYKVKKFLLEKGYDAVHVNDLPTKSETKDAALCAYADKENCVVITKDADFIDFYFIKGSPKKLVKINLGNISTKELIRMLSDVLSLAEKPMQRDKFLIEIDRDGTYTVDQIA